VIDIVANETFVGDVSNFRFKKNVSVMEPIEMSIVK